MATPLVRESSQAEWDTLLLMLALAHGALLVIWPSTLLIALGLWWNANTVSHCFIHRPFFRTRAMNAAISCYLSLLLGFPQSWWRKRHLEHHLASELRRGAIHLKLARLDLAAVIVLWGGLFVFAPHFALCVYLPGFLLGAGLCYLHGHYEHARGTVSHYGRLYNFLFFNDGYHIEHHARPGAHWRELPGQRTNAAGTAALPASEGSESRWPAVLRWLECVNLCALERLVLRSQTLQRFVLDRHERALRRLLDELPVPERVGIVGGGLFPRTAILLSRLLPESKLTLIDLSAKNLDIARGFLKGDVQFVNERFEHNSRCDFDLLVVPLAFESDRRAIYEHPPAPTVLVHEWVWRRSDASAIVSWMLLKRLNLVKQ